MCSGPLSEKGKRCGVMRAPLVLDACARCVEHLARRRTLYYGPLEKPGMRRAAQVWQGAARSAPDASPGSPFLKKAPQSVLIWKLLGHVLLNGCRKEIAFHFKVEPRPDLATFTLDDSNGPEQVAKTVYTDYDTCAVLEIPYAGRQGKNTVTRVQCFSA
ncbi:hypothetical protein MTO96_001290 [Rhipicephalus appendiculatus]